MKLTARSIEGYKSEGGKSVELSDDDVSGLYLRVSPTGVKSWMLRYTRVDGSRAKLGLGRFPAVGLADARQKALKAAMQVAEGGDPARERMATRRAARRPATEHPRTMNELWAIYDRDLMPSKRPSTQKYQRWLWRERVSPRLGALQLIEIDRATVRLALKEIGSSGPTTANRALGLVRHMLNVAVDEELLVASPVSRMAKPFKETSRDRVLRDEEIRILWAALEAPPGTFPRLSERLCAALKLTMLTGARGNEVAGIHAVEIDVANRLWTIPSIRFKGKRAHTVPLSQEAMGVLDKVFGSPPNKWSGFAFPNALHDGHPMERMTLTRAMQEVVKVSGMERATPHDLRRTMATLMASERISTPPHVIAAVLGHTADGAAVTRIYNRHAYDKEKRAALDAWAALLGEIVGVAHRAPNVGCISVPVQAAAQALQKVPAGCPNSCRLACS